MTLTTLNWPRKSHKKTVPGKATKTTRKTIQRWLRISNWKTGAGLQQQTRDATNCTSCEYAMNTATSSGSLSNNTGTNKFCTRIMSGPARTPKYLILTGPGEESRQAPLTPPRAEKRG